MFFLNFKNILNCIIYSTPFLFTALSFSITEKAGIFNLGVEGEFIISSITACVVAILFPSLHPLFLILLCPLCGIIASMLFASIIHFLRKRYNINDIFIMIILNYIALHLSNFIINIESIKSINGAETSKKIADNAIINLSPEIINKYNLPLNTNFSFITAIILCILIALFFKYIPLGHNIENLKHNKDNVMSSIINIDNTIYSAHILSAIIAGLAGSLYILSIGKRISFLPTFEGYGYTGILIALFAKSNPIAIIFSALLFGSLKYFGRNLNIINIPSQVMDLIISLIVLITAIYFSLRRKEK